MHGREEWLLKCFIRGNSYQKPSWQMPCLVSGGIWSRSDPTRPHTPCRNRERLTSCPPLPYFIFSSRCSFAPELMPLNHTEKKRPCSLFRDCISKRGSGELVSHHRRHLLEEKRRSISACVGPIRGWIRDCYTIEWKVSNSSPSCLKGSGQRSQLMLELVGAPREGLISMSTPRLPVSRPHFPPRKKKKVRRVRFLARWNQKQMLWPSRGDLFERLALYLSDGYLPQVHQWSLASWKATLWSLVGSKKEEGQAENRKIVKKEERMGIRSQREVKAFIHVTGRPD